MENVFAIFQLSSLNKVFCYEKLFVIHQVFDILVVTIEYQLINRHFIQISYVSLILGCDTFLTLTCIVVEIEGTQHLFLLWHSPQIFGL